MSENSWSSMFNQVKNMQSKMAEIQEDLAKQTVEVSTGGGMVKMTANGVNEILSVEIDDADDTEEIDLLKKRIENLERFKKLFFDMDLTWLLMHH